MSNSTPLPQGLRNYQNDVTNLRSHHWKYWIDLYTHCYYNCSYCVYRASGPMGKVEAHPERLKQLDVDLGHLEQKGIVYLGPQADIYQPADRKLQLSRKALQLFLRHKIPVFLVTRSELIRRDIDILQELANEGLVEVSITIASPKSLGRIEPNTPSVATRLKLVHDLRMAGIATSIHLSPILPYVDSSSELQSLLSASAEVGADCVYACMVGVLEDYRTTLTDSIRTSMPHAAAHFAEMFPEVDKSLGLRSAATEYLVDTMAALSEYAKSRGIPFACVHIPPLDTVEREGGIFRYKLPNVGDIVRFCDRNKHTKVSWSTIEPFLWSFIATDQAFVDSVKKFYDAEELFRNTHYFPEEAAQGTFVRRHELDLKIANMRVTAAKQHSADF